MIKLLILDIDGVVTDGKVLVDAGGLEYKKLDYQDIDAIFKAKRNGIRIGFLTGEAGRFPEFFKERFQAELLYSGCKNKRDTIGQIARNEGIDLSEICFIGDSVHDLEAIKVAGLGLVPSNAPDEVRKAADHVLFSSGGNGAVREAVELILDHVNKGSVDPDDRHLFQEVYQQHMDMMASIGRNRILLDSIHQAAQMIAASIGNGGQVLFCGNGGSAADSQHLATEFVSRFHKERRAFNAEALTTNTSSLTAISNDYDFSRIFSRQLEAKGKAGDTLVGITTSGNSLNVVEALKQAGKQNIGTVVLTGAFEKTSADEFGDIVIRVPSTLTPRIQEGHIFIGHFICELAENALTEK